MTTLRATRLFLGAALIVAGIAAIDAALGSNWDLVVVIGVMMMLQVAVLTRLDRGRPAVFLRRDLVNWLTGLPAGAWPLFVASPLTCGVAASKLEN